MSTLIDKMVLVLNKDAKLKSTAHRLLALDGIGDVLQYGESTIRKKRPAQLWSSQIPTLRFRGSP